MAKITFYTKELHKHLNCILKLYVFKEFQDCTYYNGYVVSQNKLSMQLTKISAAHPSHLIQNIYLHYTYIIRKLRT